MLSKSIGLTFAVIFAMACSSPIANAVEILWDDGDPNAANPGGGDTNQLWSMPTNWRFDNTGIVPPNDILPGVNDRANIAFDSGTLGGAPGTATPGAGVGGAALIQAGDSFTISAMRVGSNPGLGYGGNGRLDISGGTLTIDDTDIGPGAHLIIGADGNRTGTIFQTGGLINFEGPGGRRVHIGDDNGQGFYEITGGELRADKGGLLVAANNSASQGTFRISGSALVNVDGGNFETAHRGTGRVLMSGGTLNVNTSNLIVNQGGNSNARFDFSGGVIDIENQLRFNNGTGLFVQSAGTVNVGTILDITNSNGGDGTYRMTGGILNVGDRASSDLKIGNFNNASSDALMEIINGTVNISRSIRIGDAGVNSSGTLIVGDGTTNPIINLNVPVGAAAGAGNNFEVADNGTGTFTFKSGTVTLNNSNLITGQAVNSVANAVIGGFAEDANLNVTGGNGLRDWNTNGGHGIVSVLTNGSINVGRNINMGNNGNANSGLELTINGGTVQVGVTAGQAGNISYRNNGPQDQINLVDGLLASNGGTIDMAGAASSKFSFTGGTLKGFNQFTGSLDQQGGFLDPGASPGPPMVITGDYTLGAAGTYLVEVGPTAGVIDFLDIGGIATIEGTIKLIGFDNFVANVGDTFDVLQAATVNVNNLTIDSSMLEKIGFTAMEFLLVDLGNGVTTLRLQGVIPEPTTITLGMLGILGLTVRRRRAI